MIDDKSPFVSYTPEEVFALEATTYVVQVGYGTYDYKGQIIFTKKEATAKYNKILKELLAQFYNGNDKDKRNAKRIMLNFKILPFRIH